MAQHPRLLRIGRGLVFLLCMSMSAAPAVYASVETGETQAPGRIMAQQATKDSGTWNTTDHSKLKALQKEFTSGAEVTDACLSCHSEAGSQFYKTIHWKWLAPGTENGVEVGKAGYSLNNFCISTKKNADTSCLDCHPGWGTKTESVNCLVCHGQKDIKWEEAFEDYTFFSEADDDDSKELAGEIQADIQAAVQSIGLPTRKNCGSCHFYGGGGEGVKHGDLDASLTMPDKSLDVHMGVDGQNFQCVRCHSTTLHNVAGRIYSAPASTSRKSLVEDDLTSKITCESCHTLTPHKAGSKANDHTDKVACQSCHIPEFARVNSTKMWWDWSKAGQTKDGKHYQQTDSFGRHDYMTHKGQMKWEKNVRPEYFWFNGSVKTLTAKDVIEPGAVVPVSRPEGSMDDENARIYPFKVHRGKQPYDTVNRTMVAPMLSGPDGYWQTLDWKRAISKGMDAFGLPFSGEYDFAETSYVLPTTHMVAPKDKALSCIECHSGTKSRLAGLGGFYMPGRDTSAALDRLGWMLVLGSLAGVVLHGLGRILIRNGKEHDA